MPVPKTPPAFPATLPHPIDYSIRGESRHLRLVATGLAQVDSILAASRPKARYAIALSSAMAAEKVVNKNALLALLTSMRQGEHLEFEHTLLDSEAALKRGWGRRRYSFQVLACSNRADAQAFAARVHAALAGACTPMLFEPPLMVSANTGIAVADHLLRAAPAAIKVLSRSAIAQATLGRQEPAFDAVPFPNDLPDCGLSVLLASAPPLPPCLRYTVRVFPFTLDHAACQQLDKVRKLLLGGHYAALHPESRVASYAVLPKLDDAAAAALSGWLSFPEEGYAIDCVLRCSEVVDPGLARRLFDNSLNGRPLDVAPVSEAGLLLTERPTFATAMRPSQELPGLFPVLTLLSSFGVPQHFAAPLALPDATRGIAIGTAGHGTMAQPIVLPDATRAQHTAIFGATGSGKSSLMLRMIAEDLASPNRTGVVVLDPHGTLVDDVLQLIPKERAGDVIVLDVNDDAFCQSLNPLEGMAGNAALSAYMANEVGELIESLFEVNDSSGPTLRQNLKTLIRLGTCYANVGESFLSIERIIEDADFGDYLLGKTTDAKLVAAFRALKDSKSSEYGWAAWTPYVLSRFAPFTGSPRMKRLLSQSTSTIDLKEVLAKGKVLLINLSKSALGDTECQIAGTLILSRLFATALGRGRERGVAHLPCHLYVDELASFSTSTLPRILAEARKFGLCLTSANQSLHQLKDNRGDHSVAKAILSNSATKMMMRLSPADADTLEPYFGESFTEKQMARLPDMHTVVSMLSGGVALPPFAMKVTRPSHDATVHAEAHEVVAKSRAKYARDIAAVNQVLIEQYNLDSSTMEGLL